MEKKEFSISTETIIKITLVILVLAFLWRVSDILILLLIALTIASGLEPLVASLSRYKIPRAVSVLSVYILVIGIFVFVGYLLIPALLVQFQQLTNNSGTIGSALQDKLAQYHLSQVNIGQMLSQSFGGFSSQLTSSSGSFLQGTIGFFNGFIEIISIMVISFYLLAEKNGMEFFVISIVPQEYQGRVINIVNRIQKKIGLWILGQFVLSALVFAMTFVGLTLLKVQYALVLAIVAGVFEIIPYIGPFLSAIPAIIFAFIQNPPLAIFVALLYLVVQKLEGYVFVPKVMQRTLGISPLVILVAILIGLKVAGVFGVFLAVPIAAAVNVIIQERAENASTTEVATE